MLMATGGGEGEGVSWLEVRNKRLTVIHHSQILLEYQPSYVTFIQYTYTNILRHTNILINTSRIISDQT